MQLVDGSGRVRQRGRNTARRWCSSAPRPVGTMSVADGHPVGRLRAAAFVISLAPSPSTARGGEGAVSCALTRRGGSWVNSSRPLPRARWGGLLAGPSGQRGATTGAEGADTRKLLRNRARTTTAQRLTPLARRPTTPASHGGGADPAGRARRSPGATSRCRLASTRRSARCRTRSRQPHRSRPPGLRRAHLAHEQLPRPASPSPPQRHHLPPRRLQVVRPVVHQVPAPLEQVRPRVRGLGLVPHGVRQGRFDHLARVVRPLRRPVPE